MRPIDAHPRLSPVFRLLLVNLLAVGLLGAPTASVYACQCAGTNGVEQTVAQARQSGGVAFVGTVTDAVRGGDVGMIRYAFEVERASAETPALVAVESRDDPVGASCGFNFGLDERWFVVADRTASGLKTGLCSGNLRLKTGDQPDAEGLEKLLSFTPERSAEIERKTGPVLSPACLSAWSS